LHRKRAAHDKSAAFDLLRCRNDFHGAFSVESASVVIVA
jgi:hypothetical protein